jgi:stress-induced morphogen
MKKEEMIANELRSTIMNGLPCDQTASISVSPQFTGKNMLQQHQLV